MTLSSSLVRPVSILIVEDVAEMRTLLEALLQKMEGVKVSGLAKNGAEARLEMLRRRPDLLFLDEVLPGESSLDLLKESSLQGIPVVLITSLSNSDHGLPSEAIGRIEKPSWKTFEEDLARIHQFLKTQSLVK